MNRFIAMFAVATLAVAPRMAAAQTIIGDLNNFDTLNDTGQTCYGFEIEIDDARSTDITYTFDWNHYGAPRILEDTTDPQHPKVFVRYESTKDSNGAWGANGSFTNVAIPTITPPQGHTCTDTTVNEGCEHFGVGYYAVPTAVKYHWLIDDNLGGLTYFGSPVGVAAPKWTYTAPAGGAPAQVVAAIPAPVAPIAGREFGEPSWVKVVKTVSHNANPVALTDLISDDKDGDSHPDWTNGEPDEVETEWKLLQVSVGGNGAGDELEGGPDDMGDGSEVVTRRYEFYKYGAEPDTIDGETGEAMCSEVNPTTDPNDPNYLHGVDSAVAVTDKDGNTYFVDCAGQIVVGNYIGAQMAGFDAEAPLGIVANLQNGETGTEYVRRTVIVGGTRPYTISVPSGALPPGLAVGTDGVLSGTPTTAGDYGFTLAATDSEAGYVSGPFNVHITAAGTAQFAVTVQKAGSGTGTVSGNGITCDPTCTTTLDAGTAVSLTAAPDSGSSFTAWSGPCTGNGNCSFNLESPATVVATFTKQWLLSVSKAGGGSGSVAGNGIDCGGTCDVWLDEGTPVSLTAVAASGSLFTGWGGACAGTGVCNTTVSAATSVTATFELTSALHTLTVTVVGSGTVTSAPRGINCGKHCSDSFAVGTGIELTAKPKGKHQFLGWTGVCAGSGTSLTCTLPLLRDETVGAEFSGLK